MNIERTNNSNVWTTFHQCTMSLLSIVYFNNTLVHTCIRTHIHTWKGDVCVCVFSTNKNISIEIGVLVEYYTAAYRLGICLVVVSCMLHIYNILCVRVCLCVFVDVHEWSAHEWDLVWNEVKTTTTTTSRTKIKSHTHTYIDS